MKDIKNTFNSINNLLIPKSAKFITESQIQIKYSSPFNELNETSTYLSFSDIKYKDIPKIPIPYVSEIFEGYSSSGKIKVVLWEINYNKLMPLTVIKK